MRHGSAREEGYTNHEEANEFDVGEVGVKSSGTKHIVEGGIKVPKVLKDMLDNLASNNNDSYEGLTTFGLQQSGLNMTLITADRPKAYITRSTRLKQLSFPSEVRLFGKQVLPLLVLMWQFKQQILKVQRHMQRNQSNTPSNSDWLQTCLVDTNNTVVAPATSNSTKYLSSLASVQAGALALPLTNV
ncbi:unnamed protein product [Mucor fragilis]